MEEKDCSCLFVRGNFAFQWLGGHKFPLTSIYQPFSFILQVSWHVKSVRVTHVWLNIYKLIVVFHNIAAPMSETPVDSVDKAESQPAHSETVDSENAVIPEDQQGTLLENKACYEIEWREILIWNDRYGSWGNLSIDRTSSPRIWQHSSFGMYYPCIFGSTARCTPAYTHYHIKQANPREAIHDIKQSIIESPETCIYSCFYLSFNGEKLNDFQELGEVEGITIESELLLVEGN